MTKKFLTALCATALAACMCVPAFAAEGPQAGQTDITGTGTSLDTDNTADISVQLEATLKEEAKLYKVNVAWTSMDFTYDSVAPVWNPETHTRSKATGEWSENGIGIITVINHSNQPVTVSNSYTAKDTGKYEKDQPYNGVTVALDNFKNPSLQAGVVGAPQGTDGTDKTTCQLTVSGNPEESITSGVVGTITVTVAAGN